MIRPGLGGWVSHDIRNRGASAWLLAIALAAFYVVLFYTEWLTGIAQRVGLDNKWTLYGLLYTLAVLAGGTYMIRRYRHNRYQVIRTVVVMFVQAVFAFSIPQLLKLLRQPEYYVSYFWPLKFEYLTPGYLLSLPLPFVLYSLVGSLVAVPVLGVFLGKRWYCSWVCGCGGLANTFGEPWRHLSSKSTSSWRFEKVAVHAVLIACLLLTALLFVSWGTKGRYPALAQMTDEFHRLYGLVVLTWLSGILGVALYPLGGTRIWCRFFCPMAALLGILQKAGPFRISVKPDMCISCGLCSKYCEMGIDVRAYAQTNESFTRASCVGCGMCAEVCPRGVLRLESFRREPAQTSALVQIRGVRT